MNIADYVSAVAPKRPLVTLPPIKFIASPNYSTRSTVLSMVVVHDTEGGYDGAISWFRNPHSQVSAHVVLKEDGSEATQMVSYSAKAWHVASYNSQALGLEMAGFAKLGYRDAQLRRAARIVAFFLREYKLPPRYLSSARIDAGERRGFTLHQNLGAAGGGHHDPGFSRTKAAWFAALVVYEYSRGGFRKVWGRN